MHIVLLILSCTVMLESLELCYICSRDVFEVKPFKEIVEFSFCHGESCARCNTILTVMATRLFLSCSCTLYLATTK